MTLLDGTPFSEREFYRRQEQGDHTWGKAIIFGITLHVLTFAVIRYLPDIIPQKPLLAEVMTIDLVSMPDPEPAEVKSRKNIPLRPPSPPPAPEPVAKVPEPEKAVPVAVAAEPEPVPVPAARPISIRPLKRKIKKAVDTRLEEEKRREQLALDRIRKKVRAKREREKALARKRAEEQRARQRALAEEKRARQAARTARAEIAAVLQEQQRLHNARSAGGGVQRNRSVNSALEQQYYMDLANKVQRLWVLPEIRRWPPSLETVIEFTVLADGRLANIRIAGKSGDPFFDRFAMETVRKAAPMPPIPPVLKKNRLDLGFRLRPAGIQN